MQIPFQLGHRGHRATPPTGPAPRATTGFPAPMAPATLREGDTSPPSTPSGSQPCPRGTGPIVSSLLPPLHLSRHASRTSGFPPEPVAWPPALLAQLPAPGPQGCRPCPATHPRPQPSQPWGPGQSTLCPACSQHASHPQASASFLLRGPSEQAGPGREAVKLSPGCLPPPQSTACCPTQSWQAVHAHVCVHMCFGGSGVLSSATKGRQQGPARRQPLPKP